MPELPEVETIRSQLDPAVAGRTIARARVLDERFSRPADPGAFARRLRGRRIERLARRGKYLVFELEGPGALVVHLRMTGNMLLAEDAGVEPAHLRAEFELDGGTVLHFTDPRRFGHGALLEGAAEIEDYFGSRLGIEPLSDALTPRSLAERAAGRTTPLKSFLLLQRAIAGIGNIYADEALHRARLHPLSPAGSMREEHCEDLVEGIVGALRAGLANGGASIDDYRDARGERGSMQDEFLVHTREGRECLRCGETIVRIVVGGRSTYFCPACQVRLRRRPRRRAAGRRAAA